MLFSLIVLVRSLPRVPLKNTVCKNLGPDGSSTKTEVVREGSKVSGNLKTDQQRCVGSTVE